MSPAQTAATKARTELLGRLGLPAATSDDALEETHRHLAEFLDGAPADLRGWADRRQAEADRIRALLTGPESELAELAAARKVAAPAPRRFPTWARWLVGVAIVAAVVVGVYQIGKPPSGPPPVTAAASATPQAEAGLDEAKVADLMGTLEANPQDLDTLHGLADAYYAAGDYPQAEQWLAKVLEIDPSNEKALIDVGAASFNQGNLEKAETSWNEAARLYPNNPEVLYDLGFLYMNTGRMAEMQVAWARVVEIAPESAYAETVQSQVGSVKPDAMGDVSAEPTPESNG